MLTNVSEVCTFHGKFSSVSSFSPDATMSRQVIYMTHVQAVTKVKSPQARIDTSSLKERKKKGGGRKRAA